MSPLRFIRKYNKWILSIGVSLLMLTFLIGPTLQMFGPNLGNQPIGTISGQKVTVGDQRRAGDELLVLGNVHRVLAQFALTGDSWDDGDAALKWLLLRRDANRMGLSASDDQVQELLRTLQVGEDRVALIANRLGATTEHVQEAVRGWIVVQQYKELVMGRSHVTMTQRLADYQQSLIFLQFVDPLQWRMLVDLSEGKPRISRPLRERLTHDQQAKARISVLIINAAHGVDQIRSLEPLRVKELFDTYREYLPGDGKPYGFGYRQPDRVKLEYLKAPFDRLLAVVQLEEADLLSYYDEHPDEFQVPAPTTEVSSAAPPTATSVKPYSEVRLLILAQLRDQRARSLGQRMITAARAIFSEHDRPLRENSGYKQISDDYKSLSLAALADQLNQQFGVLPDVVRRDDRWFDAEALSELPGIGSSVLEMDQAVKFADYVLSAKELEPAPDNGLLVHRLQAKITSAPLLGFDGSPYIFRILEAQPATTLENLELVREQVELDARIVAAYESLVENIESWRLRTGTVPLEDLALELDTKVLKPTSFTMRQIGVGGAPQVPVVEGVGQHEALVDRVFAMAQQLASGTIATAPLDQRVDVLAVPEKLSLVAIRLDEYSPISRSEITKLTGDRSVAAYLALSAVPDASATDPFSIDVLSKRVGFKPVEDDPDA